MKKYLILGLMLTLAVPALAWLPTWMNATGTGLWTVDSLYAIYGGRIGSGYSLKFGAVSVKDSLGRIQIPKLGLTDSLLTSTTGVNSWVGLTPGTTAGSGKFVSSDSASGSTRATVSFGYNRNVAAWYFTNAVTSTGALSGASVVASNGDISATSTAASVVKNNTILLRVGVDNPYIVLSDSTGGAARTRDSCVYNGASFSFTKPVVSAIYAKGVRPSTAELGQIIIIDGDTTTDSLLVYLGGAWVVLKP